MVDVIPMFPLSHVLVPGMPLPLHIFEPRYRQLLIDVRSGPGTPSFGIVALRRGSEVGPRTPDPTGNDLMPVGTLAEILEVEPYDDGASDLLAVGSRRFRIRNLVTEGTPYLRAEIEWLDERDGDVRPAQIAVTRKLANDYAQLVEALTGRAPDDLPRDANLLSYYVAGHLPLSTDDRQALLEEPTAAARLHRAITLLRRETLLLQATRSIAVSPSVLRLPVNHN